MLKTSGIYGIWNRCNSKAYVGSTCSTKGFKLRWAEHRRDLNHGTHRNKHLQWAWNKYGEECFEFRIIEECLDDELGSRENFWMEHYKSRHPDYGYNLQAGGALTVEQRARLGRSLRGKITSAATRKKISESRKGWKPSAETRRRMSTAHTGRTLSVEHCQHISEGNKGKIPWIKGRMHDEHARAKMREAQSHILRVGIKKSPETIQRMRAALTGRKCSEEAKRKMRECRMGHSVSEETRRKISESLKGHAVSVTTVEKMKMAALRRNQNREQLVAERVRAA